MSQQYRDEAFFPMTGDGHYTAQIKISDANGGLQSFEILPDTGADLILLTVTDGRKLGFDLNMIRDNLGVEGIHKDTPGNFKVVPCWVQIGEMEPIQAPVGLATDDNALEASLLGDKGIIDTGLSATYDHTGVTYRKVVSTALRARPSIRF